MPFDNGVTVADERSPVGEHHRRLVAEQIVMRDPDEAVERVDDAREPDRSVDPGYCAGMARCAVGPQLAAVGMSNAGSAMA